MIANRDPTTKNKTKKKHTAGTRVSANCSYEARYEHSSNSNTFNLLFPLLSIIIHILPLFTYDSFLSLMETNKTMRSVCCSVCPVLPVWTVYYLLVQLVRTYECNRRGHNMTQPKLAATNFTTCFSDILV